MSTFKTKALTQQDTPAVTRVNNHSNQSALYPRKGAGDQSDYYTGQVGFV